jgi:hypothetical protein
MDSLAIQDRPDDVQRAVCLSTADAAGHHDFPTAAPMMTPIARASAFCLKRNSRNSLTIRNRTHWRYFPLLNSKVLALCHGSPSIDSSVTSVHPEGLDDIVRERVAIFLPSIMLSPLQTKSAPSSRHSQLKDAGRTSCGRFPLGDVRHPRLPRAPRHTDSPIRLRISACGREPSLGHDRAPVPARVRT